jgi:hypothetical protein
LLLAYTINELAVAVGSLALTVLVYRRTGSALAAAGYFLAAQFVPSLFTPTLVARLGQHAVRTLLSGLYAGEAVAFLALALLVPHFSLAGVLALTVLDGTLALTARSVARTASVDVLAPAGLLREGNATTNLSFSICFFVGPAIGGVVAAAGGVQAALFAVTGAFVANVAMIAATSKLPRPSPERGGVRLRAAWADARGEPALARLLLLGSIALAFFTISVPVEIVLVRHSLHAGSSAYGAVLSAWGLGAVAGSAIYQRWHRFSGRVLIAASATALGAGFVVMAAAPSIGVAIAGAAIAGCGNGVWVVAYRTDFQERLPQRLMTVMIGLAEALGQAMIGVGIVVGGAVSAIAGPRAAFAVAAAGAFAFAGAAWSLLRTPVAVTAV